eukprot:CAMPEP_0182507050 /NCGR_PEP_ID=MMETSP1321-20130603/22435_1 /TAXON_ID=91990 /ORGANISM="Bolidomonas sp., Strain RCC1657" /LENGTH=46 /DNA_ID= /DNA_START= /DNA_END= /DNA_ORIENTATION=
MTLSFSLLSLFAASSYWFLIIASYFETGQAYPKDPWTPNTSASPLA